MPLVKPITRTQKEAHQYVKELIKDERLRNAKFWTHTDSIFNKVHVYYNVVGLEDDVLWYSGVEVIFSKSWLIPNEDNGRVWLKLNLTQNTPRLTVSKYGVETFVEFIRSEHEWLKEIRDHYHQEFIKRQGNTHK